MFELLLNDPIAWGSLLGLGVVLAICGYYVYLFLHNVHEDL